MMNSQDSPCAVCLDSKLSIISIQCRICYENEKNEPLMAPCNCKGTVAFVHQTCLERWLAESNTTMCELCHVVFQTERFPKFTTRQAIWNWLTSRQTGAFARGVRSDIVACTVITPVAIIITYACLFSSEYYNQKKFVLLPAARWTSISLLIMIALMLLGYYLWVYSVIRMHARMWYNWWQRDCVVRYIPANNAEITSQMPPEVENPSNTPVSEDTTPPCEVNTATSDMLAVEKVEKNAANSEIKFPEADFENVVKLTANDMQSTESDEKVAASVTELFEIDIEVSTESSTDSVVKNNAENPVVQTAIAIEIFENGDVAQPQSEEPHVEIM